MSSTNRGYDRHKVDYYVTPQKDIREFINEWFTDLQYEDHEDRYIADRPDRLLWLDPCAGGGLGSVMSYPSVLKLVGVDDMATNDIREDSLAETHSDYLIQEIDTAPDIIITNPPFTIAREIIEKALRDVKVGGYVVMLLRLNFLGSRDRFNFWQDNMPQRIYVHHKRMSFTKDKATDSIEYAHFVWKRGEKLSSSKLKII